MTVGITYLVWVEIRVKHNNGIRAPQVDTNPSGTCRQDVYEHVRIFLVELVHILLSIGLLCVAVLVKAKD